MLLDGFDGLFHRLVRRLRHTRHEEPNDFFMNSNGGKADPRHSRSGQHPPGLFNNSKNFVVNQTFIDNFNNNNISGGTTDFNPVLKHIMTYANLDASVDSSVRFPPPTCHPRTRLKIGGTLSTWLTNPNRKSNLVWLHGPAGTGKSAVAQTFAEGCAKNRRLGASFFFSRPNERNDPNTVIPTLVYQLAVCSPHYKSLMTAELVNDPALLQKTRRVQFQKLIVEPLSDIQNHDQNRIQEPLLVVLDGLDECKDENAQREFVEMIGEVVRLKNDFPLVWLICSRPEPHLKYLFSRADFTVVCGHEELKIDAESIADVDFYIRDGLAGIKAHFADVTTSAWPPGGQITELSQKASGHFGFAWTSLRYIGDPTSSAPMRRLDTLLYFLRGISAGPSNPLEALDTLYTAILDGVPKDILSTTMQILGFFIFKLLALQTTVQGVCNFLHIDQATFYNAFRKLHSVIDIPSPESASQRPLSFYHASFEDYLRDPSRSGKFAIEDGDVHLTYAKLCLSWYKTDLKLFHTICDPEPNGAHEHGILPGLSWVSDDNSEHENLPNLSWVLDDNSEYGILTWVSDNSRQHISRQIAEEAESCCLFALCEAGKWDEAALSQIRNFDFRYVRTDYISDYWVLFLDKFWEHDSSSEFIRTEPQTEVDLRLLEYMKAVVGPSSSSRPAIFPLQEPPGQGKYFFLGYGMKGIICWSNGREYCWCNVLNADQPPSKERIRTYQAQFGNG